MLDIFSYADQGDGRLLLDRACRSPLWRQISVVLEREIRRGRFEPGDRLPPEGRLAQWFGVNRHTVRRALTEMREHGLVKVEQGRGTFVREGVVDYPVSRRTRFGENLSRQNRSSRGQLLNSQVLEADETVSAALQIRLRTPVASLHLLRHGDERPLSLSSHFFPLPRFAGIAEFFRQSGSVTACLAAYGVHDFFRRQTRVAARPATTEEAGLLGLARNRPVLETRSVNEDEHGVPVDYGVARYAGERVQLVIKSS